jgi:alpha-L-fucosidase
MLADIVSKNGNLLLNVVLRPDGTLDPEVETMLHELAGWTATNGEAIYGTRPWLVYGEGAVRAKGGAFNENFQYSARDIRFTTKGGKLYAIALGWPEDGKVLIRSLASSANAGQNRIARVELLGGTGELQFSQSTNGLLVELPAEPLSDLTCTLRITGSDLQPVPLPVTAAVVMPDGHGRLILGAADAALHGEQLRLETQGGKRCVGYWDNPKEWVSWNLHADHPGRYLVSATVAAADGDSQFILEAGDQRLAATVSATGGWDKFTTTDIGIVTFEKAGDLTVNIRSKEVAQWKPINLATLRLAPAPPQE